MSPSTQIRILLADDHAMFREGVKQLLSNTPDFVVVGEASDAAQVLEKSHRMECDVVILDISMPGRDGIEVLKQLKQLNPHCNVLILSMYPEDQYAFRAIKAGASGYLTKNRASSELIEAIRRVASGRKYITVEVCHEPFLGDEVIKLQGPIPREKGDAAVSLIHQCSEPWNKKCRCQAHIAYFGGRLD